MGKRRKILNNKKGFIIMLISTLSLIMVSCGYSGSGEKTDKESSEVHAETEATTYSTEDDIEATELSIDTEAVESIDEGTETEEEIADIDKNYLPDKIYSTVNYWKFGSEYVTILADGSVYYQSEMEDPEYEIKDIKEIEPIMTLPTDKVTEFNLLESNEEKDKWLADNGILKNYNEE